MRLYKTMYIYNKLKTLFLFFLFTSPHYTYSMDVSLKQEENTIFPIQTYPADLQCTVFEDMLAHLNTYQTTFFEDNQQLDKKKMKDTGTLRYQIACFMIEHLINNSIKPEKIPNTMKTIEDILYRGILFIPYSKMIKMDVYKLLKKTLHYQSVTGTINENTKISSIVSDVFLDNMKRFLANYTNNENFFYPGSPHLLTILKKEWQELSQENTPLLKDPIRRTSNNIKIRGKSLEMIIAMFIFQSILLGIGLGITFLAIN